MDRLISEKQVLDAICHDKCGLSPNRCMSGITGECVQIKPIKAIPSSEPKVEQWKDFALWVAKEIFVYEWEYNKDAFAEIACRKLAKLGIVRAKGDEWELVEPQERSDKE